MEAAPCDTQFCVLHGRAGGTDSSSPGGARSPLLTAQQPEPTTRPLLTEGHEASHQQLCSAGRVGGKKEVRAHEGGCPLR